MKKIIILLILIASGHMAKSQGLGKYIVNALGTNGCNVIKTLSNSYFDIRKDNTIVFNDEGTIRIYKVYSVTPNIIQGVNRYMTHDSNGGNVGFQVGKNKKNRAVYFIELMKNIAPNTVYTYYSNTVLSN
jgi:hypothetical protein